jgi:hypothetical protein
MAERCEAGADPADSATVSDILNLAALAKRSAIEDETDHMARAAG